MEMRDERTNSYIIDIVLPSLTIMSLLFVLQFLRIREPRRYSSEVSRKN